VASFKNIHLLQARFRADVSEIAPLNKQFSDFLAAIALTDDEQAGWKLVFAEMLANAIKHGAPTGAGDALRVSWWVESNVLYLETRDQGTGPDPAVTDNPCLPEDPLAEGGRGLYIIHSFVENWRHSRSSDGYVLRVWKSYPDLPEIIPEDPSMELILDELADSYENLTLYDRLGQAVVGGESFAGFLRATLQVFIDAGTPDYFHIEPSPSELLPEIIELEHFAEYKRFGTANTDLWQQFEKKPYVLWGRAGSAFPFKPSPSSMRTGDGCAIPITHNGQTVALLALGYDTHKESFGSRVVRQIQALGNILSMALSRSIMDRERAERERIRHAFQIATELQQQLLPLDALPPQPGGWEFFVSCDPAMEVAGDFAEIRPSVEGSMVGCIIDVMGKGVTAAILAGIFRSHFIAFSRGNESPASFCARVNDSLEAQLASQTMFITGVVFRIDPASGKMELVVAGHPPVILLNQQGHVHEIEAVNPPFGLFTGETFKSAHHQMAAGERCCFVTDGFFEWQTADGGLFGWDPLVDWLRSQIDYPAADIIRNFHALSRDPENANCDALSRDDETLMVLTRIK
jgi:serine phosphatase RsbU (regulator of sigma subunit)/anti-sigma regulatory factor (Ser/Thr protein kinase)